MSGGPALVVGSEVDVAFTASLVTQVGPGWIRLQTASTDLCVDLDAVDVTVAATGRLYCLSCTPPARACTVDHD